MKHYLKGTSMKLSKEERTCIDKNMIESKRVVRNKKGDPMTKVNPISLMKSIQTMTSKNHYVEQFNLDRDFTVGFEFTTKEDCGRNIIEIFERMKGG